MQNDNARPVLVRRGHTVFDPFNARWVPANQHNLDNISLRVRQVNQHVAQHGVFLNQLTGEYMNATAHNIAEYSRAINQERAQDAVANLEVGDDELQAQAADVLMGLGDDAEPTLGIQRVNDDQVVLPRPNLATLRFALREFAGSTVRMEFGYHQIDNPEEDDPEYTVDTTFDVGANFSSWWSTWTKGFDAGGSILFPNSSEPIWFARGDWPLRITRMHNLQHAIAHANGEGGAHGAGLDRHETLREDIVQKLLDGIHRKNHQYYLDSPHTHCILGPIVEYFQQLYDRVIESSAVNDTVCRVHQRLNKAKQLYTAYEGEGLADRDLVYVARTLDIRIVIDLPLKPASMGGGQIGRKLPEMHQFDSDLMDLAGEEGDEEGEMAEGDNADEGAGGIPPQRTPCPKRKRPVKTFNFVNTRFNHCEPCDQRVVLLRGYNEVTWVSQTELEKLRAELDKNDRFYMYNGSSKSPNAIHTTEATYKSGKDEQDAFDAFFEDHELMRPVQEAPLAHRFATFRDMLPLRYDLVGASDKANIEACVKARCLYFRDIYFDVLRHKRLTRFLETATHWPVASKVDVRAVRPVYVTQQLIELDMVKAYCRHTSARGYDNGSCFRGFLGRITDFGQCTTADFDKHFVGAYHVVRFDDSAVNPHFRDLHGRFPLFADDHSYSTPLLLFARSQGYTFEIDYGCWGTTFTFEYPKYMFKKRDSGPAMYCLLAGYCSSYTDKHSVFFHSDAEFMGLLMNEFAAHGEDLSVHMDQASNLFRVKFQARSRFAAPHFSMYVTSYMLINLMHQMLQIPDPNDILCVLCDAIIVSQRTFKLNGLPRVPLVKPWCEDGAYQGDEPTLLWKAVERSLQSLVSLECAVGGPIASGINVSNKLLAGRRDVFAAKGVVKGAAEHVRAGARGVMMDMDADMDFDVSDVREMDIDDVCMGVNDIGDGLVDENMVSHEDLIRAAAGFDAEKYADISAQQQEMLAEMCTPIVKACNNKNVVGEGDAIVHENHLFNHNFLVFNGEGGSGKTTSCTGRPEFPNVGYMVLSHLQRSSFVKRQNDPDDQFVTQLTGPCATEVIAMTSMNYDCAQRFREFLRSNPVIIVDEASMVPKTTLRRLLYELRGKAKLIVCLDEYQTPPVVGNGPQNSAIEEMTLEEMRELGALTHEFWYSYRHLPDDHVRGLIHELRKDMRENMLEKYPPSHPMYPVVSCEIAERWCKRLMEDYGIGIDYDEVVATMKYTDYVLTYTNHSKQAFTDRVIRSRDFVDADGKPVFRWVVHTNNYRQSLGVFNGSICYQASSPIPQTESQCRQHPEKVQAHIVVPAGSGGQRKKNKKKGAEANLDVGPMRPTQRQRNLQGHTKVRRSCSVEYAMTIHGCQGQTIPLGHMAYVDGWMMRDARVLQTVLGRVQSMSQLRLFYNRDAAVAANDPNSFKGYVYMLRYTDEARGRVSNPNQIYIGHTSSRMCQLEDASVRKMQHIRCCEQFVKRRTEEAAATNEPFVMPCPGVRGWCNSFHLIWEVLGTAQKDIATDIIETHYFGCDVPKNEMRNTLERMEHYWIEVYQSDGSTNVHGVELK